MSKEIYIPVVVTVDDDGIACSAYIDYEGAPWMYCGSADAVFDEESGDWESSDPAGPNGDAVDAAEGWLGDRLRAAGLIGS